MDVKRWMFLFVVAREEMKVMENCEIVKLRIPEEAPFLSDIEWKFPEQQKYNKQLQDKINKK